MYEKSYIFSAILFLYTTPQKKKRISLRRRKRFAVAVSLSPPHYQEGQFTVGCNDPKGKFKYVDINGAMN